MPPYVYCSALLLKKLLALLEMLYSKNSIDTKRQTGLLIEDCDLF